MTDRRENRSIWLMLLYACALGIAVSVTMTLSYRGILGSADENYLRIGADVLLRGLGFAVPAFGIVWLLSRGVNRVHFTRIETGGRSMSDRRFFLLVWAALFLSWLPYLLTFYPGGVVGDGAETLEYVIQPGKINSRWGVTQILVLRGFFAVARIFSSDVNTGIFLYAICSSLAYAAVCAAVVTELRKRGLPPVLVVLCAALYAFSGHYASYSIGLWKDGLFGASVTALSLLLWKEPEEEERSWTVKTGATLLFLCFWRNFIAYALLPVGIVLLIIRRKSRKLLAVLMILIAVFSILIQGPVYGALGVEKTPVAEALAIPLQQTAAVIKEGAELTGEQAETLYRLMPEEDWKAWYAPTLADRIKFNMDDAWLQEHVWDFCRIWIQLGIRHPGTYLKAHLMETLGFWQPYGSNQGYYYDWFTGVQDIYNRGYTQRDLPLEATETTLTPGLTDRLTYVPSGTAVWIMLLSLVLVLCGKGKKKRRIAALLPCLFCWMAVTVTAPIAYCYRYVEMLAICLPLFITLPFFREEETEAGGEKTGKIRQFLRSGEAARITAAVAAAAMVIVLICGSWQVYAFTDGKLEIRTCGAEDNHGYYIQSGLSSNEGTFTWTEGDRLTADFPYHGEQKNLEVSIHTAGTVNGVQRYRILDGEGIQIAEGEITGEEGIRFDYTAKNGRITFTVELPDAVILPNETRKLGIATTGIEIRQK